jgi:hypothetical protein
MTGHKPPQSLRAAIARLDCDTLRAVAIAYRAQRQAGASDGPAYEAAVAELRGRAPNMADLEAREAVSLIIAQAATEAQAWFWRETNHGWPPPWQWRQRRSPASAALACPLRLFRRHAVEQPQLPSRQHQPLGRGADVAALPRGIEVALGLGHSRSCMPQNLGMGPRGPEA